MIFYQWVQKGLLFQLDLVVQQNQEALEVQLAPEALCLLIPPRKETVKVKCGVQGIIHSNII